jgi:hypothetical protein
MEAMNKCCQIARKNDLPFGGIQMIVFGDLYQLPPVVRPGDEADYLQQVFGGHFFFDAPVIKNDPSFKVYELSVIHRQKDDVFKDALNEIRTGTISVGTLDLINDRCEGFAPENLLTLATTNKLVEQRNREQFDALPGQPFIYTATITGERDKVVCPAEEDLALKVGAQVMMIRNDGERNRWVNGTMAMIAALTPNSVRVTIGGETHDVNRATWVH